MAVPLREVAHELDGAELMRCDLHVHSWYSGDAGVPVLEHLGRECWRPPLRQQAPLGVSLEEAA